MPDDFTDLLAHASPNLRTIMTALRTLMLSRDRSAVEVIRVGERAVSDGPGPKKMSEAYAYILPYTGWVNPGFYRGASLPDPAGLLNATGAQMRHVRIDSCETCTDPAIAALRDTARIERTVALASGTKATEK